MKPEQITDILITKYGLCFLPSRINKKYTCIVVNNQIPPKVTGKFYNWSDTQVCIGSFLTTELSNYTDKEIINFFNTTALKLFLRNETKN